MKKSQDFTDVKLGEGINATWIEMLYPNKTSGVGKLWVEVLSIAISVASFFVSLYALRLHRKRTAIEEKKYLEEQEEKKKADITWRFERVREQRKYGVNVYDYAYIENTGKSEARNIEVYIDGKKFVHKEQIKEPHMVTFDLHSHNVRFPLYLPPGSKLQITLYRNAFEIKVRQVKIRWDDDYSEGREKIITCQM